MTLSQVTFRAWICIFFTEQRLYYKNEKVWGDTFRFSLWKVQTLPILFPCSSLIDELVAPRPSGVTVLWPRLSQRPLLDGRADTALGNRLCLAASAESRKCCKDGYLWEAPKSGYYFKRDSQRKNAGFKINKWVIGSWIKTQCKSNTEH